MKTRIYVVTAGDQSVLVRAGNRVSAINLIARKSMEAHVASQLELVEMLTHGAKVIDAAQDTGVDSSE